MMILNDHFDGLCFHLVLLFHSFHYVLKMQKNMGSIRQAQFFGGKICSNNLVNKPQPLCCIHAIRTQAHANPCINSISFYFYFFPSQFLCQRLRVFGYSFVCWTWENTATHYYVYMIIMAVYIQHSEIVDPFYIESHRHQIEVKYNIIKPSSLCVLFFFVLAAKIKSAGKKIHRIIMDETFFFLLLCAHICTETHRFHARVACSSCLFSLLSSWLKGGSESRFSMAMTYKAFATRKGVECGRFAPRQTRQC